MGANILTFEAIERKVPPAVQGALKRIRENGHTVALRLTKHGSLRYSVNAVRETDAQTLIRRFDRGKYALKVVDIPGRSEKSARVLSRFLAEAIIDGWAADGEGQE
jgi:hypothetical protein